MSLRELPAFTLIIFILYLNIIFKYNFSKQEVIKFIFVLYIAFLAYITTKAQMVQVDTNILPFREILRYDIHSRLFLKNTIGNILLFMPLGIFITHYLQIKRFYKTLFISFIFSLIIELIQLSIGRIFDIDDIILNTLGGMLGYFMFIFIRHLWLKK